MIFFLGGQVWRILGQQIEVICQTQPVAGRISNSGIIPENGYFQREGKPRVR
jgi:hypothetical protein